MKTLLCSTLLAVGLTLMMTSSASAQGVVYVNGGPVFYRPNVAYTTGMYSPAYGYSAAYGYSPAYSGYSAAYGYSPAYMVAPRPMLYYPTYYPSVTVYRYGRWW